MTLSTFWLLWLLLGLSCAGVGVWLSERSNSKRSPPRPRLSPRPARCPVCGQAREPGARFCGVCGRRFRDR